MSGKTTSVRIDSEVCSRIRELADKLRPRSSMQYIIEDALERYLTDKEAEIKGQKVNKKS